MGGGLWGGVGGWGEGESAPCPAGLAWPPMSVLNLRHCRSVWEVTLGSWREAGQAHEKEGAWGLKLRWVASPQSNIGSGLSLLFACGPHVWGCPGTHTLEHAGTLFAEHLLAHRGWFKEVG